MTNHVGQRLGNYRLMHLLGQGGFAEVYLGEHVFLGTYAAIKLLQVHLDDEEMEAFLREARTLAGLTHQNILRILEFGVEKDIPYLVMDYAPNGTLRQRHPRGSVLPIPLIIFYVKQIASALQYLHSRKLIHRDIKPENLLLGSHNEVLISDFGTATVFETLQSQGTMEMAGTLTYMAPEQIRGKPRPASDQYGLAIIVYEWLTGVPPFKGVFNDLFNMHMYATPTSLQLLAPGVPSELEEVIMTALAKDPERRFATVLAFANALEQAGIRSTVVEPPPLSYTVPVAPPTSTLPSSSGVNFSQQQPAIVEDGPTISSPTLPSVGRDQTVITPQQMRQRETQGQIPAINQEVSSPRPPSSVLPTPAPEQYVWGPAQYSQPPALPFVNPEQGYFSPATTPTPPFVNPEQDYLPPAPPPKQERHLSRRTFAFGLAGLVGLGAASGLTFWIVSSRHGPVIANPGTPAPAPGTIYVTYKGHTGAVYTLAWTFKGNHIASGGQDHRVRVWDPISPGGHDLYTFLGHSGSVNAVAWSPDGTRIASGGSDTEVLVWDALNGNNTIPYRHHTNNIRTVAWSPDGRFIASGGDDNTVQVWDAATAAPLYTYKGHTGMIWSLAWSPSPGSMRIASTSVDKTVRVWDALTGLNALTYRGHTSAVKAVAWSPDGTMVASGSDTPESTVQVWNAQTMQKLLTYTQHTGGVYAVAWSSDGQNIASSSWGEVRVWKPTTGKTLNLYTQLTTTPQANAVHTIAWSADGQRIASGGDDTTVNIWQAH